MNVDGSSPKAGWPNIERNIKNEQTHVKQIQERRFG
jgi:hypothetical protein